ncbi:MAG: NAD+ synthase [Bacteroidetes bacterium]|nr:NAD+ synthase [Bacteroidota bacterium]
MKIALAQINPIVGDVSGNARKILEYARLAKEKNADLVVFPEMCVTGYPPLDLLDNPVFIDASVTAVNWIAEQGPDGIGVLIGAPVRNPDASGKKLLNAAILLENGREIHQMHKTLLPTYDVFDESRYFSPASEVNIFDFRDHRLGVSVCEDMWNWEGFSDDQRYAENPLDSLANAGADVFINISASPFSEGKHALRTRLVETICARYQLPFVLVNQVGANTEVLFDGDSRVHAPDGSLLRCAPSFEEALLVWDTSDPEVFDPSDHDPIEDLNKALVMGIRDYVQKTGIFEKALVGLSGGIDSAVTCALAVEALGSERVIGVTMPSSISSTGSVEDSRRLAENLGIEFHHISIESAVDAYSEMLEPLFSGTPRGIAEENIQARSRGLTLMAISNKFGHLLLTTGNKSELSMGYATLYGDMSGGLAVLSDVFKTQVYRLAETINLRAGRSVIPQDTISKPPSAELSENQRDDDSLPPYSILDDILKRYIERREDLLSIVDSTGYEDELVTGVLQTVDQSEYKRRQAPPGLRVSGKAFGMGRRLPIVMKFDRQDVNQLMMDAPALPAS